MYEGKKGVDEGKESKLTQEPGEDWKVKYASDDVVTVLFICVFNFFK